jgi:tetratricopeptide (TPR) repeat protein
LISIDPSVTNYYKYRGLARLNTGDTKDAVDDFSKDLNANPKDGECSYYYSFAFKVMKDYPQAIQYAQKAQELKFNMPAGYMDELEKLAKTNGK